MPVDRPTFSESWYRVANLKPKLRASIRTYRQRYRGEMYYVLEDPSATSFGRLSGPAYHFVALLDGRKPVAEVWALCSEQMGDDAPTQNEVIQVLGQLYTSNMLDADLPPDTASIFERQRTRVRREVSGYLMNLLFMRIPLFDPDRFLERWVNLAGLIFTPLGFVLWAILVGTGAFFVLNNMSDLVAASTPRSVLSGDNLIPLYIVFALIKVVHEFGHGFACKWYGKRNNSRGEVHTIGVMLMAMMPIPYVDASSSWAFRNKWHRLMVAAAGMYVEIALAAIAAIVWANTPVGGLANALAFNVIFLASVTTILFNANPLIRFDGYYMLTDALEMPNLSEKSKQYLYYLVKRYIYGVRRPQNPARTLGERPWLIGYGIAATIYRILISISIMLFVLDRFFLVGAIMVIGMLVGYVFKPLGSWMHYLFTSTDLARTRPRALIATGIFLLALVWTLGIWEYPERGRAMGVVEPRKMVSVNAGASGFVTFMREHDQDVSPDTGPLMVAENLNLRAEFEHLLAFRRELEIRHRQALGTTNMGLAQALRSQLQSTDEQIAFKKEQIDRLEVTAPFAGRWVAPMADRFEGAYIRQGEPVGVVATLDDMIIRAAVLQNFGPRIDQQYKDGTVEIRVNGRPDLELTGKIARVLPDRDTLPTPALSQLHGGSVPVAMDEPSGVQAAEHFFEVIIEPNKADLGKLMNGERVIVRFELPARPLIQQWWLKAMQMVQRRFPAL
jgi:putative peptide zinc metalloprotease protein